MLCYNANAVTWQSEFCQPTSVKFASPANALTVSVSVLAIRILPSNNLATSVHFASPAGTVTCKLIWVSERYVI